MRVRRMTGWILGALAVVGYGQACTKQAELDPLSLAVVEQAVPKQSVRVNFCTDDAQFERQYLKTVIILDHSGSNKLNYQMDPDGSGKPYVVNGKVNANESYATDPTGSLRYGSVSTPKSLLNYLSTVPANDPADPTRFFALVDFNSQAFAYPDNQAAKFTSDTVDFFNHVQQDATASNGTPTDIDSTSYLSALNKAYDIISGDVQNAQNCAARAVGSASPGAWCPTPGVKHASSYVIIFMSDGSPILHVNGLGIQSGQVVTTGAVTLEKESTTDILGKVNSMTALAQNTQFVNSVNLFTIYYYKDGNPDLSGQTLLASMAKVGNGIGYNALSGSSIDYTQFQPPAKLLSYKLNDILVTNASAVWWTDGQLHQDSDLDGLPDDVELAWGTDPKVASTAGNGISDLVRYRLAEGAACANKNAQGLCTDPVTNYASGLCSGVKSTVTNGKRRFVASDPNGLNDCEKILLQDQGGIAQPDSNGDQIPDWLEFLNNIPFQAKSVPALNVPDQTGYSLYEKLKYSLPMTSPVAVTKRIIPSVYNMTLVSHDANHECYTLDVTDLPLVSTSDTIRVDVIESSPLVQNDVLYRVGHKTFAGESTLIFNDWNDATEKAAGTWEKSP